MDVKIEQLKDNVEALELALSPEQIAHIESVAPFDPGFPAIMCVSDDHPLGSPHVWRSG